MTGKRAVLILKSLVEEGGWIRRSRSAHNNVMWNPLAMALLETAKAMLERIGDNGVIPHDMGVMIIIFAKTAEPRIKEAGIAVPD